MIVTDKEYFIDTPKIRVLNFLCHRVSGRHKHQNVIICDGNEGYGKSTLTSADAYYLSYYLRRPLKLFFDPDKMVDYALKPNVNDEIIIWDDAAISALTIESYNQSIIKIIKLLMLARKKRNTYFINIQDVVRLKEPLVARATGMNRVYSPDGLKVGKYCYYNQTQTKYLYDQWIRRKKRVYKYYSFLGGFPNVLYKVFDEKQYESLKDKSILSINKEKGKSPNLKQKNKFDDTKRRILLSDKLDDTIRSELLGISKRMIYYMKNNPELVATGEELNEKSDGLIKDGVEMMVDDDKGYITPLDQSYLSKPLEALPLPPSQLKTTAEKIYG